MQILSIGQATRPGFPVAVNARGFAERVRSGIASLDKRFLVLLGEGTLAALSYALALFLLAQGRGHGWTIEALRATLVIVVAGKVAASAVARLPHRSLRYGSASDLLAVLATVTLSGIALSFLVSWGYSTLGISFAVFVVDGALLTLFWGGLHFGARFWRAQRSALRKHGKRAVIVGAGDAGVTLAKQLATDPAAPCRPVALADDDARKWGRKVYGVPVLGGTKELSQIAARTNADEILICIPSATHTQMHDLLDACRRSNLPVRSLPSLAELTGGCRGGNVSPRDLCRPRIEYLLQRREVRVDAEETRQLVGGKTVLVTGAGGSIGSELCRQIAAAGPKRLLLLDKSENSLFYVHLETSERLGPTAAKPFLADVLEFRRLRKLLAAEQPEIIFHAAAHKHVAMLEMHPQEAIRNNVIGARNVALAAHECRAARFVNVSSDKAVSPHNFLGLSKKLTELCIQDIARGVARNSRTRFANVRFGNVAGSTGSVVRLFWDQIQKGGPVRVTDPRASRYFMSIPEAVHLTLRAAALGHNGETFVLDMGVPVNIYELARTMILFAGLKPNQDVPVEFIGLREGEKLSEALWEEWERPAPASSDRILVIPGINGRARGILSAIEEMELLLKQEDTDGLLRYLRELFPEFQPGRAPSAQLAVREPAPALEASAEMSLGAA